MNKHKLDITYKGMMKFIHLYVFSCLYFGVSSQVYSAPTNALPAKSNQNIIQTDLLMTELEDHDDFYMLNTGKKATFLRKKDIYVLINDKKTSKSAKAKLMIQQQFGNNVEIVKDHRMGKHTVVRIIGKQVKKATTLQRISESGIGAEFVSPILTDPDGVGQIAVKPGLVVRIQDNVDTDKVLSELESSYSVKLQEALKFTDREFELKFTEPPKSVSDVFSTTRAIMSRPDIEWAEPLFMSTPIMFHSPNDTLYNQQWHLNNTGQNGALDDADIDAPEGWDLSRGGGTVIAIIDSGVQTDHPDLAIWTNPGESGNGKENNGIDDDGNGYIDDYHGWDFGKDDNNPNPGSSHGTSVAGVAAAIGNNDLGVIGSAPSAEILPIKINLSLRDEDLTCSDFGNAFRYAAKYAEVINNSWGWATSPPCQSVINSAISDVVHGKVPDARRGTKGSPVIFASGNSASGWIKITSNTVVTANTPHTFTWVFAKDSSDITGIGYDTAWFDHISWPDGSITDFNDDDVGVIPSGFTGFGNANWKVTNDGIHARGAMGHSIQAGAITDNQTSEIEITRSFPISGSVSFWVWVSAEYNRDRVFFFIDFSVDQVITSGAIFQNHYNDVAYPASNVDTIAVGASSDGGTSGEEERTDYSQFGPELDVVAPSRNQNQGITTTAPFSKYIDSFGGTSSASTTCNRYCCRYACL